MITHTIESYWIPRKKNPKTKKQTKNKTKQNATNLKNLPKFQIFEYWNMTHRLKLLDKMCKYEMDPVSIVEDTEDAILSTDGQRDGRKRWN